MKTNELTDFLINTLTKVEDEIEKHTSKDLYEVNAEYHDQSVEAMDSKDNFRLRCCIDRALQILSVRVL